MFGIVKAARIAATNVPAYIEQVILSRVLSLILRSYLIALSGETAYPEGSVFPRDGERGSSI